MSDEFSPDIITLIGDDGKNKEFEILDLIENDEGKFYVLAPYYSSLADAVNSPCDYHIFEVSEHDGEEELFEPEGEKLERIAKLFEERYNDSMYGECE